MTLGGVGRLVFLDTETTGLSLWDDIWDVALIGRTERGDEEVQFFVDHSRAKAERLPEPFASDYRARFDRKHAVTQQAAAARLHSLLNGVHIVGAVPNFDTERIARLLERFGYVPPWHYHLIDVETLAVGYLLGQGNPAPSLPWNSDDLSRACGVEPPTDERHTALGDARWVRDLYDHLEQA